MVRVFFFVFCAAFCGVDVALYANSGSGFALGCGVFMGFMALLELKSL